VHFWRDDEFMLSNAKNFWLRDTNPGRIAKRAPEPKCFILVTHQR